VRTLCRSSPHARCVMPPKRSAAARMDTSPRIVRLVGVSTKAGQVHPRGVPWTVVCAAAPGLGQHPRRQAVPHHERQPEPPDRAPPLSGPSRVAVCADRPEVQAICERYGLPYNTDRLSRQFGSVVRKIFRLALP
jgi:hypothetical protein